MLRSQQDSAPAHISLKRVNEEATASLDTNNTSQSFFWSPSDITDSNQVPLPCSSLNLNSTPKTASQLFLDNLQGQSYSNLFQFNLPYIHAELSASGPPSATTASGSDKDAFAANSSDAAPSPAMSAGSHYNFGTPSLHQVSALTAPFSTSSPAVASVGITEADSGKTSPSTHEHGWSHYASHDRKGGLTSPDEYSHPSIMAGSHQAHHGQYNDHDYQSPQNVLPQYFQHRASISGPLMDSANYAQRYESTAATPAPPRVHGLAAWENASGSARPHTADGMFGQFGAVGPNGAANESSAESSVLGHSNGSTSRPYTPGGLAANADPYYQHRRLSMPDPSVGPSKVFSYMAPNEDGNNMSSSSMGASSHSYGSHYFGGGYGAASKKRPRRRYDEIERLYPCSWPGCTKSYGTLNHLNAHVAMQKHGPKRSPSEFKDMRKAWRKQKKEEEQRRQARQASLTEQALRPSFSGSAYGDMGSGQNDASVLPTSGSSGLAGFGAQHATNTIPSMASMPHLSRYSMSSVSANPNASQGFYLNGASDSGVPAHSHNATPLQYPGDNRLPYAGGASTSSHYNSIGAYLSAHRGSV